MDGFVRIDLLSDGEFPYRERTIYWKSTEQERYTIFNTKERENIQSRHTDYYYYYYRPKRGV